MEFFSLLAKYNHKREIKEIDSLWKNYTYSHTHMYKKSKNKCINNYTFIRIFIRFLVSVFFLHYLTSPILVVHCTFWVSQVAEWVTNLPVMQETQGTWV